MLQSPRRVFAALRDDSDEAAEARQDAAGTIVWLAGIAVVLATTVASTLLDDPARDWVVLAVWAFLAGGLSGFTQDELKTIVHLAVQKAAENRAKILAAAKG